MRVCVCVCVCVRIDFAHRVVLCSFSFAYIFTLLWVIVATVSGTIIDNLGQLRDMRSAIADDLEQRCFMCSISRSLFEDVSESGFIDHVHNQHNIWDYLRCVCL